MYGWSKARGLGGDYYDLLAQANLENCSPMDSACVSNNVAKQAAVEDLWVNKYMKLAEGAPDDLVLTFTPQTAGQVEEFYSGSNPYSGGNVIDTRGILTYDTGTADPVRYIPPPEPSFKATIPVAASAPPVAKTPAPKTVINSSGPDSSAPGVIGESFNVGGSFLSAIPWWGWLGGVGVAAFALGGKR